MIGGPNQKCDNIRNGLAAFSFIIFIFEPITGNFLLHRLCFLLGGFTCDFMCGPTDSVVEPFHFAPALAPDSQDGGSSYSSVVHNLLLEKKFLKISLINLPGLVFFKERYTCFALLF